MEIGEPAVLVKLPQAGLSGGGKSRFCQVYGVRNGLRKKRHEVCAAVDGNSVNVYEVVNGRNLASWPVPPDVTFTCQPYSERIQLEETSHARRVWCATRRRGQLSVIFYESSGKGSGISSSTKSHPLKSLSDVISIAKVEVNDGTILVAQEDGQTTTLSVNCYSVVAQAKQMDSGEAIKVRAVQHFTLREAQASVLKSRLDLAANLPTDTVVTLAIYEKTRTKGINVGLWACGPSTTPPNNESQIEPLFKWSISAHLIKDVSKVSHIQFDAPTSIEITTSTTSLHLDFGSGVPPTVRQQEGSGLGRSSKLVLSAELDMYLTSTKLEIRNRLYDSVLAVHDLNNSQQKRKRDSDGSAPMSLVAYFSRMQRILACSGSQIYAIDITSAGATKDALKQGSLLIGNILRGTNNASRPKRKLAEGKYSIGRTGHEKHIQNWPLVSQDLDAFAEKQDVEQFEQLFKQTFKLANPQDLVSNVPPSKRKYLLSKLLDFSSSSKSGHKSSLHITMPCVELLKWCISAGFMDECYVAEALNISRSTLSPGTIAEALFKAQADPVLLDFYIQRTPYLSPESITATVKKSLAIALNISQEQHGSSMANSQKVALASLKNKEVQEGDGPETKTVIYSLRRLAHAGQSTVSRQLCTLEQSEVLTVIQVLRQQLFRGGFSQSMGRHVYPSPPPSEQDEVLHMRGSTAQLDLSTIVTLLNGCIDALGPVGILGSGHYEEFVQKMVPELSSEISAALEAVEDSTGLQGHLREVLRYAESVERQPFEVRKRVERKAITASTTRGQITTVYSEADISDGGKLVSSALPLTLKAQEDIERVKTRKDGSGHRRSAREMGMLKDRLKSPYSFEKLVL